MTSPGKSHSGFISMLVLAACLAVAPGDAGAAVQYLSDGAINNGTTGGWDLPAQGSCLYHPEATTRPLCLAVRQVAASSAVCTATPIFGAWSTSVCNDLVNNTAGTCVSSCSDPDPDLDTPYACEEAGDLWIERVWSAATGICAIAMEDADRNAVICAKSKGNWITSGTCVGVWAFPAASSYNPPLLNTINPAGTSSSSTGPGAGDQCLRCHNSITQYNGARVRDVEDVLYMGHRNMSRKVVAGNGWGGPPLACTNPSASTEEECEALGAHWYPEELYPQDDSGNAFDWMDGEVIVGGVPTSLYWIYADWISPYPRTVYVAGSYSSGANLGKPLMSYSCARCHTTGWTSDSAVGPSTGNLAKEPEKSFPGITWDGVTLNTTGKVNLAGNVSGDTNKFASWDQFGIQCSRCHYSAVDNTSNGGNLPFSAPANMSTHHNNLTGATFPSGSSGGVTYYGFCTDSRFLLSASNVAASKTACETAGGTNIPPAPGAGLGKWITPCSDNNYASQASCEGAGATWSLGTASCTVAGLCNNIAGGPYTTSAACLAAPLADCPGGVTCQWANATDINSCNDAGGHYTGNATNRGQIITSLCMQCHRQETSGMPYADTGSGAGSGTTSHPGNYVKVGAYHSTVTYPSHPHGNMFLNGTHGKFSGTFEQISTARFGTGYSSFFQFDGEAAGTGNGCTGCHNPHRSQLEQSGAEEAVKPCQECHEGNYEVDLTKINHLATAGTPLDPNTVGTEEAAPCITCHMPHGEHMFRINTDPTYSTFPMPAALTSTTNANTAADGSFTNAVWVDLDAACGQCHGGGSNAASTTLTANASTATLTVASTTGFAVGQRISVADGGNYEYDENSVARGDFETYVVSITAPNTLTVVGAPPTTLLSGKAVVQNPTKNGAMYRSKADLAKVAKGMHSSAQLASTITFTTSVSGLTVNVDADVSCGSNPCPALLYSWAWGDVLPDGSGETASHTYATAGNKTITLSVSLDSSDENNTVVGSLSRTVTVKAPNLPPNVSNTVCTWTADSWTMQVADHSTDTDSNPVQTVVVDWGDGSTRGVGAQNGVFNHVYVLPGTYTATLKAIDSALQTSAIYTCPVQATPAYFTITGTVYKPGGSVGLGSASITVKKGTAAVKTVFTAANGTYSVSGLKPGTYTLTVTKVGYTFPAPLSVTVGPSQSGKNVTALTAP